MTFIRSKVADFYGSVNLLIGSILWMTGVVLRCTTYQNSPSYGLHSPTLLSPVGYEKLHHFCVTSSHSPVQGRVIANISRIDICTIGD